MSVRSTMIAAAALAASLTSLGFAAAPAMAQTVDGVQIPHQDLNLASAAGRATLDRRIAAAARSLCGSYNNTELKFHEMSRACQADVLAEARPQRDALIGGERYAAVRVSRQAN